MLLLGHRGAPDIAHPENTVASIERALRAGADGVEVDVRMTRDDVLVLCHDASLQRTAGVALDVATTPYAELLRHKLPGGHDVPRLDAVTALLAGRGRLVAEVKTSPWPSARRVAIGRRVAAELGALLPGSGCGPDLVVSSFDPILLTIVRAHAPGLRTALLTRPGVPAATTIRRALSGGHAEAHPHVRSLLYHPQLVAPSRRLGVGLTAWTVNRPDDLRRLAAVGVEAVITDDPGGARAVLARVGPVATAQEWVP